MNEAVRTFHMRIQTNLITLPASYVGSFSPLIDYTHYFYLFISLDLFVNLLQIIDTFCFT